MKNTFSQLSFKKLFILCLLAPFVFCACKKGDNGGSVNNDTDAYLKCKINGEWLDFKYQVNANDPPSDKVIHFVVIGGNENSGVNGPSLTLRLTSSEGAKVNTTYNGYPNSTVELYFDYYYQTANGTVNYEGGHGGSEGSSAQLTITSLTDWGVKGTFSGVLINYKTKEAYTVTEGSFSAPYN